VTTAPDGRRTIGPYSGVANCTNPIFAAALPGRPEEELCNLPRGPRSRELVVFAVLGGVPESLATATPSWMAIVGADPERYNLAGIDPHMRQSIFPRAGLQPPSTTPGDNGSDPVHGREWDTRGDDLQYACTFPLATPRQCSENDPSCDCAIPGSNPPLCSVTPGQQLRGKAYPSIRPLRVAQGLGPRGIVGSICAGSGYDATLRTLADRLATRLAQ
jgi:hypothetical protein